MTTAQPRTDYLDLELLNDLDRGLYQVLEGRLQRVNYRQRELTVLGQCQVWYFQLAPDCRLWFNDESNILRCFHPLDRVKVIYRETPTGLVARAVYAWEQ